MKWKLSQTQLRTALNNRRQRIIGPTRHRRCEHFSSLPQDGAGLADSSSPESNQP
jgi:hypothetical protein